MISHNRYPWSSADDAYLIRAKRRGARHKTIARKLMRTPRAVDQHVARMKELGFLKMHEREEQELLAKLESEALLPSRLG